MLYYGDDPASGHGERADKNRYNTMAMMMMAIMSRDMIIMISHVVGDGYWLWWTIIPKGVVFKKLVES